ncbi:Putative membrane protein [Cronobacter turicensis 564]|nr:Putative membrane protein [Cronobacter turicensis 564]
MKSYLINHNCIFTESNNELKNTDNPSRVPGTMFKFYY